MAKGAKNKLTVAVPVNVELDTLLIADAAEEVIQSSVLGRVARALATVGLRAFIFRSTTCVGVPIVLPVSVNVTTIASLVCSSSWGWLTVLAP